MSSPTFNEKNLRKTQAASDWLRFIVFGICMGIADIIPGISGGTIAFIMGFYETLLDSIKSINATSLKLLFKGQFRAFFDTVQWQFLLGLLSGIVIAMVSLAHFVTFVLNHAEYRPLLYSAFFGLIVAASILCGRELKKWTWAHLSAFGVAAVLAFLLTETPIVQQPASDLYDVQIKNLSFNKKVQNYDPSTEMLLNVPLTTLSAMMAKGIIQPANPVYNQAEQKLGVAADFAHSHNPKYFDEWIIFCGAIAICAMILPGISGSYLLTILGMYAVIIGALADFAGGLTKGLFDTGAFFILLNMLFGIALGIFSFTRVVSWVLKHYHDLAIATLTGFMVGALQSVWPFWSYDFALIPLKLEKGLQIEPVSPILPNLQDSYTWIAIGLAFTGAIVVFALQAIAQMSQNTKVIQE